MFLVPKTLFFKTLAIFLGIIYYITERDYSNVEYFSANTPGLYNFFLKKNTALAAFLRLKINGFDLQSSF